MPRPLHISNHDPPALPWQRTLVVAVVIFVVLAGSLELLWRSRDYRPGILDSPSYWALTRSEVDAVPDERQVVLVGSSRFQLGLNPAVMDQVSPGNEFLQLSVKGANPLPLLEDLSGDQSFNGTVLFEYTPSRMATPETGALQLGRSYVSAYHTSSLVAGPERRARAALQSTFVLLHPELGLKPIIRSFLRTRRLPVPPRTMQANRFVDTSLADPTELEGRDVAVGRSIEGNPILSDQELKNRLQRLATAVNEIRSRGGDVLFFRPNSSGYLEVVEEERFPRAEFYERAKKKIGGIWLHYQDDNVLKRLECPDGSHVMGSDANVMSKRVAELLFTSPRNRAQVH